MQNKLTLTVDSAVVERAKKVAKRRKTSVSRMVENYLSILESDQYPDCHKRTSSSLVRELRGRYSVDATWHSQGAVLRALRGKYLK